MLVWTMVIKNLTWGKIEFASNSRFLIGFGHFYWTGVEVSKQTRNPINPPNPSDSARKLSDPMPAMVGSGSSPIKPEIGGSVNGFEHEKPRKTDPTGKLFRISILRRFEWLPVWFCPISSSYTEILPDLFEIWRDLVEISPDLFEICQDLFKIRPDLVEIRQDLFEIRSNPAKTKDFGKIRRRFL